MKTSTFLNLVLCFVALQTMQTFAQTDRLLIGDNNNGQIVMSDADGSNLDTINLGGIYQSFYDADIDLINQKIYMAWYYGIYWMNYDGTGFDTLFSYPGGGYCDGIAVDAANGFIYWNSTPDGEIYKADLAATNIDTILTTTGYLGDIDIDLLTNKLYFTQWITSEKGVFVADADGTNMDTIAYGYDAHFLGLDMANEVIYFADNATSRRINYNQTNDVLMFSFQCGGFFVDTVNSKLYVTNITGDNVQVSNLDGSGAVDLFPGLTLAAPFGPVLFPYSMAEIETQFPVSSQLNIYPNPASDQIRISGIQQPTVLFIYNVLGELVLTTTTGTGEIQVNISDLAPGNYVIVAESAGFRNTGSLVVKR